MKTKYVKNVFGIDEVNNDITPSIDIKSEDNIYDNTQNISIETFGYYTICCSSIINFFKRPDIDKKDKKVTKLILIKYRQHGNKKILEYIYEMLYTIKLRDFLFGNILLKKLQLYVDKIKQFPSIMSSKELLKRFNYKYEKKNYKTNIILKLQ